MKKKLGFLVTLVCVMALGLVVNGCDSPEDEKDKFDKGIINDDWYLVDLSNNKTGSIITISGNSGTLTAKGDDFLGDEDNGYEIGGGILRNISYIGIRGDDKSDVVRWWNCESRISSALSGRPLSESEGYYEKQYISYNTDTKKLNIYIIGDAMWYNFMK
ncbi:MAG: hypothetical protein LBB89_07315 [Treponema sp.]|jgi:hypothetical protein|nr:hypothetical protein [Treponema sp.]